MKRSSLRSLLAFLGLFLVGCIAAGPPPLRTPAEAAELPVVPAAAPAPLDRTESIEPSWKERIAQPYLYVEHLGDYRDLGAAMRRVMEIAAGAEVVTTGAPFALFFDDPGSVPTHELRARACLPVDGPVSGLLETAGYDVLPAGMVVYARVAGAYPEVPRAYPALFGYLGGLGGKPGTPIREVYLVNPGQVATFEELVTEVQVPWAR